MSRQPMSYEAWRLSFQSDDQAARAAYAHNQQLMEQIIAAHQLDQAKRLKGERGPTHAQVTR